jgi:hypothetical protein
MEHGSLIGALVCLKQRVSRLGFRLKWNDENKQEHQSDSKLKQTDCPPPTIAMIFAAIIYDKTNLEDKEGYVCMEANDFNKQGRDQHKPFRWEGRGFKELTELGERI